MSNNTEVTQVTEEEEEERGVAVAHDSGEIITASMEKGYTNSSPGSITDPTIPSGEKAMQSHSIDTTSPEQDRENKMKPSLTWIELFDALQRKYYYCQELNRCFTMEEYSRKFELIAEEYHRTGTFTNNDNDEDAYDTAEEDPVYEVSSDYVYSSDDENKTDDLVSTSMLDSSAISDIALDISNNNVSTNKWRDEYMMEWKKLNELPEVSATPSSSSSNTNYSNSSSRGSSRYTSSYKAQPLTGLSSIEEEESPQYTDTNDPNNNRYDGYSYDEVTGSYLPYERRGTSDEFVEYQQSYGEHEYGDYNYVYDNQGENYNKSTEPEGEINTLTNELQNGFSKLQVKDGEGEYSKGDYSTTYTNSNAYHNETEYSVNMDYYEATNDYSHWEHAATTDGGGDVGTVEDTADYTSHIYDHSYYYDNNNNGDLDAYSQQWKGVKDENSNYVTEGDYDNEYEGYEYEEEEEAGQMGEEEEGEGEETYGNEDTNYFDTPNKVNNTTNNYEANSLESIEELLSSYNLRRGGGSMEEVKPVAREGEGKGAYDNKETAVESTNNKGEIDAVEVSGEQLLSKKSVEGVEWLVCWSSEFNRNYYYNSLTEESCWEIADIPRCA